MKQGLVVRIRRAMPDWFTPALLLMIVLAWLYPGPGLASGSFSLKSLGNYGISVIFFLYGLRLSFFQMVKSVSHWRLHLVIQSVTFLLFPLLLLLVKGMFSTTPYQELWMGVFFLAALPSTVSSAVVMVSLAGGNVPGAVFNATVSSMAGIIITPLWMGAVTETGGGDGSFAPVVARLGYQILVPLVLGILLHSRLGGPAIRYKNFTRYFDQSVILIIVYTSFSSSFNNGSFEGFGPEVILTLLLALLGLFLLINVALFAFVRLLRLPREDMITALFCGSTKSLMHGSVMARVLFNGAASGGVMLLPVLLYHAMQLAITGVMSQRFAADRKLTGEK